MSQLLNHVSHIVLDSQSILEISVLQIFCKHPEAIKFLRCSKCHQACIDFNKEDPSYEENVHPVVAVKFYSINPHIVIVQQKVMVAVIEAQQCLLDD